MSDPSMSEEDIENLRKVAAADADAAQERPGKRARTEAQAAADARLAAAADAERARLAAEPRHTLTFTLTTGETYMRLIVGSINRIAQACRLAVNTEVDLTITPEQPSSTTVSTPVDNSPPDQNAPRFRDLSL
jgi:hypothetical protein